MKPGLITVIIVAYGLPLFPQATDLIDTRQFAGRAVAFEGKEGVYLGMPEAKEIGDVNGDGISDLGLIHFVRDAGMEALTFHVIMGGSGWSERNPIARELEDTARFWPESPEATGYGRTWIGTVGDLNADGFAEFASSATSYEPLGTNGEINGVLFIVYGKARFDEYLVALTEISDGVIPGTIIYNSSPMRRGTGWAGASVVDLNGDSRKDLVTGGINDNGTSTTGVVYVLTDPLDLGSRIDLRDLGGAIPGFTLTTGGYPGTLADAGDFDGDGLQDLLINAKPASGQGSVFLFYGNANIEGTHSLAALSVDGSGAQRFLPPSTPEDPERLAFGGSQSAVGVGDVNGDGYDDVLIGESYGGFTAARGRVYLIFGGPRFSAPLAIDELPGERIRVFHGLGRGDRSDVFGSSVGAPGDVNGDGIPDLLMSAPRTLDDVGEAYLIYGRREFPEDLYLEDGFDGILIAGAHSNGALGLSLGSGGDFNADGNPDFLVVEPQLSSTAAGGSRAIVVFGRGSGLPPLHSGSLEPRSGMQRGGTRVSIRGSGFENGLQVRFGARGAHIVSVLPTEIVVESPSAEELGEVAVTVTLGGQTVTARDRFEYVPDRPEIDLNNPARWGLRIDASPAAALGLSLDFADLGADGMDDLLIGSDFLTDWVVTIVHGARALPETLDAFTPGSGTCQIWKRSSNLPRLEFAVRVRTVGDINGDGIADMAAAALSESSYLFFGRRNLEAELDFETEVTAGRAVRLLCDQTVVHDFAPVGDLTGDNIDDFAMAIAFSRVVFIAGRRGWPQELDVLDDDESSVFSRLTREDTRFAVDLAAAGDVNDDGYRDLLVSGESFQTKTAYLVYTRPALELPRESIIDQYLEAGGGVLFEWEARVASFSELVIHVAGVGDVNRDGIDDFVFGDEEGTVGESHQGVTYLVYGRRDFPMHVTFPYRMGSPLELEGVIRLGTDDVDQAGRCVGVADDYNGDGYPDFLIGSQGNASIDLEMPGRMHVVFGSPDLPLTLDLANLGRHGFRLNGIRRSTWMTVASPRSGDLNDDGADDFAFAEVSSPYWQAKDGSGPPPPSVHVVFGIPSRVPFIRGDADDDGGLNITDAVFTLSYLFLGGVDPLCEDATDADDRGTIELTDAVYLLNHLFLGGSPPPSPYPTAGDDPTEDLLGCRGF